MDGGVKVNEAGWGEALVTVGIGGTGRMVGPHFVVFLV